MIIYLQIYQKSFNSPEIKKILEKKEKKLWGAHCAIFYCTCTDYEW